ncbi:hypothetical protein FKM82_024071 [Ascaphus truei]
MTRVSLRLTLRTRAHALQHVAVVWQRMRSTNRRLFDRQQVLLFIDGFGFVLLRISPLQIKEQAQNHPNRSMYTKGMAVQHQVRIT